MTASRKIEPTKKIAIRVMTELAALATARSGLSDSAAAMVAISAPTMEKMTVTTPAVIARPPLGKKPPCEVRLLKSRLALGQMPKMNSAAADEEDDDGGDLDAGEPELELAERGDRDEVGPRHEDHQARD